VRQHVMGVLPAAPRIAFAAGHSGRDQQKDSAIPVRAR
jgi:hypothetical protein